MQTLRERGLEPLDPAGEPFFDVAWKARGRVHVCEVKSTRNSEVHQIRLGLGQIIQYGTMLAKAGLGEVRLSLLVETDPVDPLWKEICESVGVTIFWPDCLEEVADRLGLEV